MRMQLVILVSGLNLLTVKSGIAEKVSMYSMQKQTIAVHFEEMQKEIDYMTSVIVSQNVISEKDAMQLKINERILAMVKLMADYK